MTKLFVISGSSGVGKGTVIKDFLSKHPEFRLSMSCTTRGKREGEAHGVNYFDTSPRYCKGFSEQALGIALSKHKRSEFVVATKLSNFATEDQTLEASIAMYRNSFKQLRVDYIDYYLLHAIGEKENYLQRYVNNGVLNFLLNERAAGRIKYLGWSFHGTKEFFDYMLNEQPVKFDFVQIQMNYKDWHYSQEVNADYL